MVKCSVIIVSYNVSHKLRKCLQTVIKHTQNIAYEIIVVDNDSRDDSVAVIRNEFPQVELIESDINLGFAAANNLAMKTARGEYFLYLNPDTELIDDAISQVIDYLDGNPEVGLASCSQVNPDMSHGTTARPIPNSFYKGVVMLGLAKPGAYFSFANELQYSGNDPIDVDGYVVGAFFMCRRECLDQVGKFDERFFLYYEEVELCMRVAKSGWKITLLPAVKIIHDHGSSAKAVDSDDKTSAGTQILSFKLKSEYLFFRKTRGLLSVIANYLVEYIALAIFALKKKNRSNFHTFRHQSWIALKSTAFGKYSPPKPWK